MPTAKFGEEADAQTVFMGTASVWKTASGGRRGMYHYTMLLDAADDGKMVVCSCEGFLYRGECKHVRRVVGG